MTLTLEQQEHLNQMLDDLRTKYKDDEDLERYKDSSEYFIKCDNGQDRLAVSTFDNSIEATTLQYHLDYIKETLGSLDGVHVKIEYCSDEWCNEFGISYFTKGDESDEAYYQRIMELHNKEFGNTKANNLRQAMMHLGKPLKDHEVNYVLSWLANS